MPYANSQPLIIIYGAHPQALSN